MSSKEVQLEKKEQTTKRKYFGEATTICNLQKAIFNMKIRRCVAHDAMKMALKLILMP